MFASVGMWPPDNVSETPKEDRWHQVERKNIRTEPVGSDQMLFKRKFTHEQNATNNGQKMMVQVPIAAFLPLLADTSTPAIGAIRHAQRHATGIVIIRQ